MISYVTGILSEVGEKSVTVETGGFGIEVLVPERLISELPAPGDLIRLHTYFQVSEDSQKLYGFLSPQDKAAFKKLITVNGVGPRAALNVLGTFTAQELMLAVLAGDEKTLAKAPGLGAKTAAKIILELKDKFSADEISAGGVKTAADEGSEARRDVIKAMTSMGYSASQALAAIDKVESADELDAGRLLSRALQSIDW